MMTLEDAKKWASRPDSVLNRALHTYAYSVNPDYKARVNADGWRDEHLLAMAKVCDMVMNQT